MGKKILVVAFFLVWPFVCRSQVGRLPTVADIDYNYSQEVCGVDDMAWTWWFGPQVWSSDDYKSKLWWGYTSAMGYTGIAEYDVAGRTFRKRHLKMGPWRDDHNNSVVVLLPDRRLGVIYTNGHDKGNQVFVRISKTFESIDEFDDAVPIDFAGTTTYVQYFFMNGRHYIFTRTHQDTYKWAWTSSEDFVHWSEPAEFISASDKRYYIKMQRVIDVDGIIRIIAYGHPTQSSDCNIRMGFINFNDGNIYNKDGKTVVTRLGESFYFTDLDVLIPHDEGKVLRLFDVAAAPMDECGVALASFTKEVKTDSRYLIFMNGSLHDIAAGGLPFWNSSVYLGGMTSWIRTGSRCAATTVFPTMGQIMSSCGSSRAGDGRWRSDCIRKRSARTSSVTSARSWITTGVTFCGSAAATTIARNRTPLLSRPRSTIS